MQLVNFAEVLLCFRYNLVQNIMNKKNSIIFSVSRFHRPAHFLCKVFTLIGTIHTCIIKKTVINKPIIKDTRTAIMTILIFTLLFITSNKIQG